MSLKASRSILYPIHQCPSTSITSQDELMAFVGYQRRTR
uniref:Uncharacterized protein n=1 Tax=Arundo donax TaxID=35708 RepID=A0A0A8XXN6_ARUDO